MPSEFMPWIELALRWAHVLAGISWIGTSFYFVWLDNSLRQPPEPKPGVAGELWAVHGGGFYHKQKYIVAPPTLPEQLHWFKWEAYFTWISGFLLMSVVYYLGAELFLIDRAKLALTSVEAIALSLAFLAGGWIVYDGLCRSPLGKRGDVFALVWAAALIAAAYALGRIFNDRAAFMQVGAMIGTVMAANVFMVIIPNQRKATAAMLAGQAPDPSLGAEGQAALAAQQLHDLAGGADHDQRALSHAVERRAGMADPGRIGRCGPPHPALLQLEEPWRFATAAAGGRHGDVRCGRHRGN